MVESIIEGQGARTIAFEHDFLVRIALPSVLTVEQIHAIRSRIEPFRSMPANEVLKKLRGGQTIEFARSMFRDEVDRLLQPLIDAGLDVTYGCDG